MKKNQINNLLFGIELEFSDVKKSEIENSIESTINFYKSHSLWNVIRDCTCTIDDQYTGEEIGGEVVSPILNFDNHESFKEIKFILNTLNKHHANVNDTTGFHLHFNSPQVINSYNYIDLYDLWLAFETVIYKFGFNQYQRGRKLLDEHAIPLKFYQKEYLEFISNCRKNKIKFEELYLYYTFDEIIFINNFGLNFANTLPLTNSTKNTIEIKCCDSTFDYEEVITISNFFKNIFEILINDYDKEYISYLSNKMLIYDSYKNFINDYKKDDLILFEELLKLMNLDSKQEEKYIRQYLK